MRKILNYITGRTINPEPSSPKDNNEAASDKYSFEELVTISSHYNGFKREKAVKSLGSMRDPRALPVLLVRANDWVSEVRVLAKESIVELLTPENVNSVIEHLPQIYHLLNCGREEHQSLIVTVNNYLVGSANAGALIQGIDFPDKEVSRICLVLVLEYKLLSELQLAELGLKNRDVIVRLRCADLLANLQTNSRIPLLKIAMDDKYMPIRREALQLQLKLESEKNEEIALKFLFDRHSSIRTIAINFLVKRSVEITSIYLAALKSAIPVHVKCGIWAIGHLSLKKNLEKVIVQLTSPFSSVRKQAIVTLHLLNYKDIRRVLFDSLFDESLSVSKCATKLLMRSEYSVSLVDITSLTSKASSTLLMSICFSLSRHINKWDRLIFIVRCLTLDESILDNDRLENEYRDWNQVFNNSGIQPSREQLLELFYLYHTNRQLISKDLSEILSFTLRTNKMKLNNHPQ